MILPSLRFALKNFALFGPELSAVAYCQNAFYLSELIIQTLVVGIDLLLLKTKSLIW